MRIKTKELVLFALFGTLMFGSDILMEFLPNVHLLAMFIVTFTVVYRKKALIPIYVYVFLNSLFAGPSLSWIPYLYLWTILWAITMLLPKNMPNKVAVPVYMITCALHGFLFGTLYAPAQALMFGLDFKGMLTWIIAGLPWDAVHGVSNFFAGALVLPLVTLLRKTTNAKN